MDRYTKLKKIGEGAYGVVFLALDLQTNKQVAVKRVNIEKSEGIPPTSVREIAILQKLHHPNIISLLQVLGGSNTLNLVFEYMDMGDLSNYMRERYSGGPIQHFSVFVSFLKQLLLAVDYCHANRVIHRDIKPANILIDQKGTLKLCDFGLAMPDSILLGSDYYVVTRWYRAPELLLGATRYNNRIDMWSVGCVLVDMMHGYPLYKGDDEAHQIQLIIQSLGIPKYQGVDKLPSWKKYCEESPSSSSTTETIPLPTHPVPQINYLIKNLFILDPDERLSARDAVKIMVDL